MTCRPNEGDFIASICKEQVSADALVDVKSREMYPLNDEVRIISYNFCQFDTQNTSILSWSASARPRG